jgi:hypothetical protein
MPRALLERMYKNLEDIKRTKASVRLFLETSANFYEASTDDSKTFLRDSRLRSVETENYWKFSDAARCINTLNWSVHPEDDLYRFEDERLLDVLALIGVLWREIGERLVWIGLADEMKFGSFLFVTFDHAISNDSHDPNHPEQDPNAAA